MVVRLVVALVLVAGPATDDVGELAGWDAERFQEIADRDGRAWVDEPVEYPPGSVVVFDRLAGGDVVDTHRRLVARSVVLDLGMALALARRVGPGPARAYLWLGLPLVPFGYQRLDLLVTAIAGVGALALVTDRGRRRTALAADGLAALAIAVGATVKIWPVLLVVGAVAIGRWRAAAGAVVLTAAAGVTWLATVGNGLEPVDQVLSLRGATGWHVESLPGALVALFGGDRARLELNAYRIGTLRPGLVAAGRVVAVMTMAVLALAGYRRVRSDHGPGAETERTVFALAVLGAVAALVVTAPLLSPQFLVWLVPWAALAGPWPRPGPARAAVALTALAAVLTGLALHGFGPDGLSGTAPAGLLTTRNLVLVGLVAACVIGIVRPSGAIGPGGSRHRRPESS